MEDERRQVEEPLLPNAGWQETRPRSWKRTIRIGLAVTAFVLTILLVLGLVVASQVGRIAKRSIAATDMAINRMGLSQPTSDSVNLDIELSIGSSSPFKALVGPSNLSLYYDEHEVGVFAAPDMTIKYGSNDQYFHNSTLEIANMTAWTELARGMMQQDKVKYEIRGALDIQVSVFGLVHFHATDVPLRKVLSFAGMRGLRKMDIASIDMTRSTETSVLASIQTCLYNPSISTLRPVGRLCLHAYHPTSETSNLVAHLSSSPTTSISVSKDDKSHSLCTAYGSTGYNLLELEGEMVGTNAIAISDLISKYLSHTPAELTVVPCSSHATSISIYDAAMHDLEIPATLPPQEDPLLGRMHFQAIDLQTPEKGRENEAVGLQTVVQVEAHSPLGPGSSLLLSSMDMNVGLYAVEGDEEKYMGMLSTESVEILDGRLVETSNISVNCSAEMTLAHRGVPFGAFVRQSILHAQVSLKVQGRVNVVAHGALGRLQLRGLPMNITSNLDGMGGLDNVSVDNFHLPGNPSTVVGEAMDARISIWNPSIFSVRLGKIGISLALSHPLEMFGQIDGSMSLAPATNDLSFRGVLAPAVDSRGRVSDAVSSFFSKYLRGQASTLVATIESTAFPDCAWMHDGIVGVNISTVFPGVHSGFQLISDYHMNKLDVVFHQRKDGLSSKTNTQMLVSTDLSAVVKMPPSIRIPFDISNVSVALELSDRQHLVMGSLRSDREQCFFNQSAGGAFRLNMRNHYPMVFDSTTQVHAMQTFISSLITARGSVPLHLTSNRPGDGAFPYVTTRMGILPLSDIPIQGDPEVTGMNSFEDPPVRVRHIDIIGSTSSQMTMSMSFSIVNPSATAVSLGPLELTVLSQGFSMGLASIRSFALKCCHQETRLEGTFVFFPESASTKAAETFLSNFVSGYFTHGQAQEIAIQGSTASTPLDLLQPALNALHISSRLPTLAQMFPETPTLVTSSVLFSPPLLHLLEIPTALKVRNPFRQEITILHTDLVMYPCEEQTTEAGVLVCHKYYNTSLAHVKPPVFDPISIPPSSRGCMSCCEGNKCTNLCPGAKNKCMSADINSLLSPEAISAFYHTAVSGLLVRVNGTIEAAIGAYKTRLSYQQQDLLVTLRMFDH